MSQKIPKIFECICCDYNTSNKKDYNKHLLTRKHANNNANNGKIPKKSPNYECEFCSKVFKDRAGLWRHNKKCNEEIKQIKTLPTNDDISKSDIIEILKQNQEFKELLTEQQNEIQDLHKQIIDSVKHNGNTVNQTINNNQKFNLNFFLNEQCKDAINMSDFLEDMTLDLEDLVETGRLGYVGGISRILVNKLQELDIYKRPLHCTDLKRETLYIRDNDEWSKEDNSKQKMNELVNRVANKNCKNIHQWTDEHPEYQIFDSPENLEFMKLTQAVLGGFGDQESKQFRDKIVRNVIKEVMVSKT